MRPLSEIYFDYEQALGRNLTDEEKDHCYICQITGAWGFADPDLITKDISDFAHGKQEDGFNLKKAETQQDEKKLSCYDDLRYCMVRAGNPMEFHAIPRHEWIKHTGIIFCPDKLETNKPQEGGKDKPYCAQFVGRTRYRVWLTPEQAERAIRKMAANKSLLTAVEEVLEVPMSALEKELIKKIMKN